MNRFKENAFWMVLGRVFQMGLTFITTMVVARYLGPDEYGKIGHTYSYIAMFLPICTLGINDIIVKQYIDNKDKNEEIVGTTICLRLLSSIISIILVYLIISIKMKSRLLTTITLLQALSLLFQTFDAITYWYQSNMMSKKIGIIYIIVYVLTTIFRIAGVVINKDIRYFAFAVSLDYILVATLLVLSYLKLGKRFKFSFKIAKELLNKSWHYIFASIMIVIYGKIDTILVGDLIDDASVGYYTAATNLCNAWPFLLTAIIDFSSPAIIEISKTNKDLYLKRIKQLYATIFYLGLFVGIVFFFGSNLIINILYGKEYAPSISVLKIVCWNSIFAYLGVARATYMQCEGKQSYEKILSFLGALFSIITNYLLIKNMGIIGAAIALSLTQFLTNFVIPLFFKDIKENSLLIIDAIMLKGVLK